MTPIKSYLMEKKCWKFGGNELTSIHGPCLVLILTMILTTYDPKIYKQAIQTALFDFRFTLQLTLYKHPLHFQKVISKYTKKVYAGTCMLHEPIFWLFIGFFIILNNFQYSTNNPLIPLFCLTSFPRLIRFIHELVHKSFEHTNLPLTQL